MGTKVYRARTLKEAFASISRELGPDAIVVSRKSLRDSEGVRWQEVVASGNLEGAEAAAPVSLAVLPFVDMSHDKQEEYFCDGMSEEIINKLARTEGLKVVARTSSFAFKGKEASIPEIGEALRATHLLEGSIRKAGDRFRVAAQLISAADGYHVWSETFDMGAVDIFEVQDRIALAIIDALKIKLKLSEHEGITKRSTDNLAAYDLFQKARYCWNRMTPESLSLSVRYCREAIDLQPDFADAFAGMAYAYLAMHYWAGASYRKVFPEARHSALAAIEMDDTAEQAFIALGYIKFAYEWDWGGAWECFERAQALRPSNADSHLAKTFHLSLMGRLDEALTSITKALEYDPFSVLAHLHLGDVHTFRKDYGRAVAQYSDALRLFPGLPWFHHRLSACHHLTGDREQEAEQHRLLLVSQGTPDEAMSAYDAAYEAGGMESAYRTTIGMLEQTRAPATFMLDIHARLSEWDEALTSLARAIDSRDTALVLYLPHPLLDPLRSDPRCRRLLQRMKL